MPPTDEKMTKHTVAGVPILREGTFRGNKLVKFDVADLRDMAANSGRRRKVPIKVGHADAQVLAQEDGQPALGWLNNFRVDGDKLLADLTGVPDVLHRAMEAGMWPQRSAELDWHETSGWEVTALALLGADLPAIAGLPDIEAYLAKPRPLPEPGAPICLSWPSNKENTMAEELKKTSAEEAAAVALRKENETLRAELAQEREERRVALFAAAKDAALQPIDAMVKEGRLEPRFRESVATALDTQKGGFKPGVALTLPVALSVELFASAKLPKESGAHVSEVALTGRPDAQLAGEIRKYSVEKKVPFLEAQKAVFALKPELVKQYSEAVTSIAKGV